MLKFEYNKKEKIMEASIDNPNNIYLFTINKHRFTKRYRFIAKCGELPFKPNSSKKITIFGQSKWPKQLEFLDLFEIFLPFKVKCHSCGGWGYSHEQFYNYSNPRHCNIKRLCIHCKGIGKIKTTLRKWVSWRLFEHCLISSTRT